MTAEVASESIVWGVDRVAARFRHGGGRAHDYGWCSTQAVGRSLTGFDGRESHGRPPVVCSGLFRAGCPG